MLVFYQLFYPDLFHHETFIQLYSCSVFVFWMFLYVFVFRICLHLQSFPMLIIDLGSYPNLFHVLQLISMLSILKGYKKVSPVLAGALYVAIMSLSQYVVQMHDGKTHTSSNDHALYKVCNIKMAFSTSKGWYPPSLLVSTYFHLFSVQFCSDESIISGSQRLTSDVLHGCVAS